MFELIQAILLQLAEVYEFKITANKLSWFLSANKIFKKEGFYQPGVIILVINEMFYLIENDKISDKSEASFLKALSSCFILSIKAYIDEGNVWVSDFAPIRLFDKFSLNTSQLKELERIYFKQLDYNVCRFESFERFNANIDKLPKKDVIAADLLLFLLNNPELLEPELVENNRRQEALRNRFKPFNATLSTDECLQFITHSKAQNFRGLYQGIFWKSISMGRLAEKEKFLREWEESKRKERVEREKLTPEEVIALIVNDNSKLKNLSIIPLMQLAIRLQEAPKTKALGDALCDYAIKFYLDLVDYINKRLNEYNLKSLHSLRYENLKTLGGIYLESNRDIVNHVNSVLERVNHFLGLSISERLKYNVTLNTMGIFQPPEAKRVFGSCSQGLN